MQRVSKTIHRLARRDKELWRNICFDKSPAEERRKRAGQLFRPSLPFQAHPTIQDFRRRANAALSAQAAWVSDNTGTTTSQAEGSRDERSTELAQAAERTRALANWDPSYANERVDWYAEFVARHAPISVSWLQPATEGENAWNNKLEVRGLGLYGTNRAVAPLEDGSVCIWDIHDTYPKASRGAILARSRAGMLADKSFLQSSAAMGINGAVSIDHVRDKAYIAVSNHLLEIDLQTLNVSNEQVFPSAIATLSDISTGVPLTVGTKSGLHLHDPRLRLDYHYSISSGVQAPLVQPGPTAIHHLFPHSTSASATTGEIIVAGRFPSLLIYDRRTFPKLRTTFHSGAQLCALTSLPYSFRSLETDLMRQNQLSVRAAQEAKSYSGDTLFACGEYQGKGSLEIYGLAPDRGEDDAGRRAGKGQISTYKNRVSASRSKLLSIAAHGTRLVVSDGDGQVRWLERDGQTLVRRWNINSSKFGAPGENMMSGYGSVGGDVALKLLPVHSNPAEAGNVSKDEILVWTGEKIGVIGFASKPRFGGEDGAEWEKRLESAEEAVKRREERIYGETMRRALERQADEVRWVRGLGLGK